MRILIYGAGVLGSSLAHHFFAAGRDVTLLARGDWYSRIHENGLVIRNVLTRKTTVDRIPVIENLSPEDTYDVIFVVMQSTQIPDILDTLKENGSNTVVFVGNNIHAKDCEQALPEKPVLFGFYNAAGGRKNDRVESLDLSGITIGRTDGSNGDNALIQSWFDGTGVKPTIENHMDDWLKCHVAAILPLVYLAYYTGLNLRKIKYDYRFIRYGVQAIREGYQVLLDLGYKIKPDSDKMVFEPWFEYGYALFLQFLFSNKLGDLCITNHATAGLSEMTCLSDEFDKIRALGNTKTPALSDLEERFHECIH